MQTYARAKADWQCKVVVIGDSGVGKTCVMRRFTDNEFSHNFVATIGIDFRIKHVQIKGKNIKVQIWDTAGQEKYKSITTAYYRGARGVLILYDITNVPSFDNVVKWVTNFRRWAGDDVEAALVANKCDLNEKRGVLEQDGRKLAKSNEMFFCETSAKENINVEEVFNLLLQKIVERQLKTNPNLFGDLDADKIEVTETNKDENKTCCNRF